MSKKLHLHHVIDNKYVSPEKADEKQENQGECAVSPRYDR
jgi:hypothetical protein